MLVLLRHRDMVVPHVLLHIFLSVTLNQPSTGIMAHSGTEDFPHRYQYTDTGLSMDSAVLQSKLEKTETDYHSPSTQIERILGRRLARGVNEMSGCLNGTKMDLGTNGLWIVRLDGIDVSLN